MKILFLLLFLFSAFISWAQVQPMNHTDYGFPNHGNFGAGVLRQTNSSAYLEVGRPSGSRKGLMLARGNKDSVFILTASAEGLLFYDKPTKKPWYWDGTQWIMWGSGSGAATLPIAYTATGGEMSVTNASLTGKSILSVARGAGTVEVITSGTPAANQALFDPATGVLTFGAELSSKEYVHILYQ